jgi:cytochrome c biogenesis protein CcmG/thiol:disulfide interchange protein DsbE
VIDLVFRRLAAHRRSLVALLFAAFAMPTAFADGQHTHPTTQPGSPIVGSNAPAFDLKTLDGATAQLQTFHGKPLVVNFFASWCDPCREEMPLLNDLAAKSADQGYNLLGIAVEDTRAAVTEFATDAKLVFPIALDLNSTVKRAYRIFGPPATFFIDSRGVIRDVVLGPLTAERARQALQKAAGGLQ